MARRWLDPASAADIGTPRPGSHRRASPRRLARSAQTPDELHDALLGNGFLTERRSGWGCRDAACPSSTPLIEARRATWLGVAPTAAPVPRCRGATPPSPSRCILDATLSPVIAAPQEFVDRVTSPADALRCFNSFAAAWQVRGRSQRSGWRSPHGGSPPARSRSRSPRWRRKALRCVDATAPGATHDEWCDRRTSRAHPSLHRQATARGDRARRHAGFRAVSPSAGSTLRPASGGKVPHAVLDDRHAAARLRGACLCLGIRGPAGTDWPNTTFTLARRAGACPAAPPGTRLSPPASSVAHPPGPRCAAPPSPSFLGAPPSTVESHRAARTVHGGRCPHARERVADVLREHGASFFDEIADATGLLRTQVEDALGETGGGGLANYRTASPASARCSYRRKGASRRRWPAPRRTALRHRRRWPLGAAQSPAHSGARSVGRRNHDFDRGRRAEPSSAAMGSSSGASAHARPTGCRRGGFSFPRCGGWRPAVKCEADGLWTA